LLDVAGELLGSFGMRMIIQHHGRARLRQLSCDAMANARIGAGDQRDLVGE
jgi:hypothetical protein